MEFGILGIAGDAVPAAERRQNVAPGASPVKYTHFVVAERGLKLSPLLGEGGVAAPYKKMSRSHLSGRRRGGSFKRNCFGV